MVARTDERGAATAADELARRLRGDSAVSVASSSTSDVAAYASGGVRRRRQTADKSASSGATPTHVRVPRTARRASILQRILNSTGRAHLLERIKRERHSDSDDDDSSDSDDSDDAKLPQTIRRRVSRIFLQRFLKKQDVACEADFCLYFELQAREPLALERSSSASIADWVRRRTSSSSVLAPSPSHVQDDALGDATSDQLPAAPRDADETHTVIEITAMLLRDAGCQVMLYPLQHADSDVLPESKRDAQAYVMTVGYAEPSADATATDTNAIPLDRSVHHTLPPHHQKLPPYVTLHPAYTQQILPLAGYAQTQQLTKLILKECRADHNLSLASGDLVFQANTPILQQLAARSDVAVQLYPLHRDDFRAQMIRKWANDATYAPPLADIYAYYGPKIAMYFAWLDFYTRMLVVPSVAGVVVAVAGHFHAQSYSLLSLCLAIGTSVFVDVWRRKQREVEYTWKYQDVASSASSAGTVTLSPGLDAIETRPEFVGEWMDDPVTHEVIFDFPRHKRLFRQLLALPLLLTMCCGVGAYVVGLNMLSENLRSHYRSCYHKHASSDASPSPAACALITHGPGVLNALIIYAMDVLYQQLAWRLNEFENYRTAQAFEDNLVLKRMPFHFVNSNASIWFLAFYVQDLDRVRERLWILMVAMQLLDNFKEVGLPFVVSLTGEFLTADGKRRRHSRSRRASRPSDGDSDGAAPTASSAPATATRLAREHTSLASVQDRVARVLMQKRQAQYKDTFADYKEMMIQYGYVALYSPIFPLAPVFAWLNNVVESRSDFLKLVTTHSYQRPLVQHTRGIGVWEHVLVAFSGAAVIVNFALVWTYELDDLLPTWSDLHKFMFLVVRADLYV